MVNLADLSPLVAAGGAPPPAAREAAARSADREAVRAAALRANSALHHGILDFRRRPLHELSATLRALVRLTQGALDGEWHKVRCAARRARAAWTRAGSCASGRGSRQLALPHAPQQVASRRQQECALAWLHTTTHTRNRNAGRCGDRRLCRAHRARARRGRVYDRRGVAAAAGAGRRARVGAAGC